MLPKCIHSNSSSIPKRIIALAAGRRIPFYLSYHHLSRLSVSVSSLLIWLRLHVTTSRPITLTNFLLSTSTFTDFSLLLVFLSLSASSPFYDSVNSVFFFFDLSSFRKVSLLAVFSFFILSFNQISFHFLIRSIAFSPLPLSAPFTCTSPVRPDRHPPTSVIQVTLPKVSNIHSHHYEY